MWPYIVGGITSGVVVPIIAFKIYMKTTIGKCTSKRQLDGLTAIVTGANAGIGYETAKDLVTRGANVILAARNEAKGEIAVKNIIEATGKTSVRLELLDLTSFKSVREFADRIIRADETIDILINNAGMIETRGRILTDDGLESQSQTNHFGPFMLTMLLLPQLQKSSSARIITVSSQIYEMTKRSEFRTNFSGEINYRPWNVYANTKLANILFTRELARKLSGTNVTANALNPGFIPGTSYHEEFTGSSKVVAFILRNFGKFLLKTVEEGAQTTIYLAVDESVEGTSGEYFADCKLKQTSSIGRDMDLARELWELSERVTDVKFPTENRAQNTEVTSDVVESDVVKSSENL